MSIKLVKFSNGKFGVRKGNWFTGYRYKDLSVTGKKFWWPKDDRFFDCCMGSEEVAREDFTAYKNNEHLIHDEVIE
jgi:hypothetical protein